MAAKAAWLLHIPEIVSQLETFSVPVVDRAIIEHLFDYGGGRRSNCCTVSAAIRPAGPFSSIGIC
jgi:hypothetical protein